MKSKFLLFFFTAMITFFNPYQQLKSVAIDTSFLQVGLADIQVELAALEATMPKHGSAFIKRVVNKTKYPLGIKITESIHDKLPNGTIVRLKSKATHLGESGKYYKATSFADGTYILSPCESDPKKASRFQVFHKLSKTLVDWLGFAYAGEEVSSGETVKVPTDTFMCMDNKKELVVLKGTRQDFENLDNKEYHWKLVSDESLKNAVLVNRSTQQNMWALKGKRSILSETISHPIDEVWGTKLVYKTVPGAWHDSDQTLKIGDTIQLWSSDRGNPWAIARDSDSDRPWRHTLDNMSIRDGNGIANGGPLLYGQVISLMFPHGEFLYSYDKWETGDEGFNPGNNGFFYKILDASRNATNQPVKRGDNFVLEGLKHGHLLTTRFGDAMTFCVPRRDPWTFLYQAHPILPRYQDPPTQQVDGAELFTDIKGTPQSLGKDVKYIAIVNPNLIWGIGINNHLLRWNSGAKRFEDPNLSINIGYVAASPNTNDVFLIESGTNKIYQCSQKMEAVILEFQPQEKLKELAVVNNIMIWGLDVNGLLHYYSGRWENKGLVNDKKVKSITITTEGSPRVVTEDGAVFNYDAEKKQWIPGTAPGGEKLKKVSGDYGISENKNIYRYDNKTQRWTKFSGDIKTTATTSQSTNPATSQSTSWEISQDDKIRFKKGSDWITIEGIAFQICAGSNGHVWKLGPEDVAGGKKLYRREGITKDKPEGTSWTLVEGGLVSIAVGPNGEVWGANDKSPDSNGGYIFFRAGITASNPSGTYWLWIPGAAKQIAIGHEEQVFHVCNDGSIWYRTGISKDKPEGTGWNQLDGKLLRLAIGAEGQLWGLGCEDAPGGKKIFFREGITKDKPEGTSWKLVDGGLVNITVGSGGQVQGVNSAGTMFRREGITPQNPSGTHWSILTHDDISAAPQADGAGYDDVFAANGFISEDVYKDFDLDAATAEADDDTTLKYADAVQLLSVKDKKPWGICTDSDTDKKGAQWSLEAMEIRNKSGKAIIGKTVCYGDIITFMWKNNPNDFLYIYPGAELGNKKLGDDPVFYQFQILDENGNATGSVIKRGAFFKLRGMRHGELLKASEQKQVYATTLGTYDTFTTDVPVTKEAAKTKDISAAVIGFEIEKLGDTAGQLQPGGASSFGAIPADKSPNITGFAETITGPFSPGQILTLPPMKNQGGAFLEEPFMGRGTFSVVANTRDQGGLQLLLGDSINNTYIYKIVIGGANNTRSTITKRTYEGLTPKDTVVAENTAIVTTPGADVVYWVSFETDTVTDKIKVGKAMPTSQNLGGDYVGEGTFMSCIVPHAETTPTRVAIASEQKEIACSYIRNSSYPVVIQQSLQSVERNPEEYGINIADKIPFRVSDAGALKFLLASDAEQGVYLENSKEPGSHYLVVFGEGTSKNISIYKGITSDDGKTILIPCSTLSGESYPNIKYSAKSPREFFVSYDEGLIIVGMKSGKKNNQFTELIIYNDLAHTSGIDTFRFFSQQKYTPTLIRILAPIQLTVENNTSAYSASTVSSSLYDGKIVLLTPFDWKFEQDEEVLTCYDNITNQGPARVQKVTEPGAFYDFNIEFQPDGMPNIALLTDPQNPTKVAFDRKMLTLGTEAELKRKESELAAKSGALETEKIRSAADLEKRKKEVEAQKVEGKAGVLEAASTAVGTVAGQLGRGGIIAQVAATGMSVMATGLALGAQIYRTQALDVRSQGELAAITKEAEAIEAAQKGEVQAAIRESEATIIEAKAKAMQGLMDQLAVNAANSYVYLENINRPAIAESEIESTLKEKKVKFLNDLTQIEQTDFREKEATDNIVSATKTLLLDIDHYYLINEEKIRERILMVLQNIKDKIGNEPTLYQDLIDLYFIAYNNPFLVDKSDVQQRRLWLSNIRNMANNIIKNCTTANENDSFTIRESFGEYTTLGKLPTDNEGLVTFEVQGLNDLFLCFTATNNQKIRNSDADIYEFDIDGWNGTKSVIRVNSLGTSVTEIAPEGQILSDQEWVPLWFNIYQGHVCMGQGDPSQNPEPILLWKDPYPTKKLPWVMIGSWNSPITIRKISIQSALPITGTAQTQKTLSPVTITPTAGKDAKLDTTDKELAAIEAETEAEMQQIPEATTSEEGAMLLDTQTQVNLTKPETSKTQKPIEDPQSNNYKKQPKAVKKEVQQLPKKQQVTTNQEETEDTQSNNYKKQSKDTQPKKSGSTQKTPKPISKKQQTTNIPEAPVAA